jgi:hypothetical protein
LRYISCNQNPDALTSTFCFRPTKTRDTLSGIVILHEAAGLIRIGDLLMAFTLPNKAKEAEDAIRRVSSAERAGFIESK